MHGQRSTLRDALRALRPRECRAFNVGIGHGFSVREVLDACERAVGRPIPANVAPRREGDPPVLVARADRIKSVLGWTPRLDDLDTIVRTSLEWERKLLQSPW